MMTKRCGERRRWRSKTLRNQTRSVFPRLSDPSTDLRFYSSSICIHHMDCRTCLHARGLHPSMIDWAFSAAYNADNARSNVIHCFDGYSLHGETQTCLSCVGCAQELVGWIKSGKVAEATRQVFAYIQSRLDGFDEERRLIEERRATQVALSQMSAHSTVPHALLWHRATRTSHHLNGLGLGVVRRLHSPYLFFLSLHSQAELIPPS